MGGKVITFFWQTVGRAYSSSACVGCSKEDVQSLEFVQSRALLKLNVFMYVSPVWRVLWAPA